MRKRKDAVLADAIHGAWFSSGQTILCNRRTAVRAALAAGSESESARVRRYLATAGARPVTMRDIQASTGIALRRISSILAKLKGSGAVTAEKVVGSRWLRYRALACADASAVCAARGAHAEAPST